MTKKAKAENIGVLLVNIGTPEQPTVPEVRKYLAEFLQDRRIIPLPRLLWLPILYGFILRTRPHRSALAYQKIWTEDGSPLLVNSRQQVAKLNQALAVGNNSQYIVELGMRYGTPSIKQGLQVLRDKGCQRVLIFPVYPQFSDTTTTSTWDASLNDLKNWQKIPEFRFVYGYHDDPAYIDALATRIQEQHHVLNGNHHLLFSFHGLPEKFIAAGDPYRDQCYATAKLLADKLQLHETKWSVAFQSRVGLNTWIKPYCDETLRAMPGKGIKNIAVFCPGFSADCLETLEEIAIQNKEMFLSAGGEQFHYIPALNATDSHIAALTNIVYQNTADWQ